MDKRIQEILKILKQNGHQAYLIGGSSLDEYLNLPYCDVDITTDALPQQVCRLFFVVSEQGKMFGNVKIEFQGLKAEITTFRVEDYCYPSVYPKIVRFSQKAEEDSWRRDFTINALYMDENNKITDFHLGINDLQNRTIRLIGDPIKRLKEDPSRILRGLRLKQKLGFKMDESTKRAFIQSVEEIKRLSINKLAYEIKKTYEECGVEQTNQLYEKERILTTLFGYNRVFFLNQSATISLEIIKEQLEEMID